MKLRRESAVIVARGSRLHEISGLAFNAVTTDAPLGDPRKSPPAGVLAGAALLVVLFTALLL
jgi:hypothetical protein